MYQLQELADYVSFDRIPLSWEHCLADALDSYDPNWLENLPFDEIMTFYELEEPLCRRLSREIQTLRSDEKLNFLCWLWRQILFFAPEADCGDIWTWDSHSSAFSSHGSPVMATLVLLSGYPIHQKNMEKYHFDEAQIRMQKYGIRYYCTWDGEKHGTDGMRFRQMIFSSGLISGLMTWHGRLQFEWVPGGLAVLKPFLTGNPPVIFVHIPEDGPLDETIVSSSLKTATEWIPKYYSFSAEQPPVFFTQSWLLSPQLKDCLPAGSRILSFQKHFKLLDVEECPKDFLYFVFDLSEAPKSLESLPENTGLQKEIKKRLINGLPLERGLGILQDC